jgi:predicted DNA-binding ribbon-helix-helix protein
MSTQALKRKLQRAKVSLVVGGEVELTKSISVEKEVYKKLEVRAKTEGLTVYQLVDKWYKEGRFDSQK